MNDSRLSTWVLWLLPFAAFALLLGYETNWGRGMRPLPEVPPVPSAQPVNVALLPEYRLEGGIEARRETVDRTLFNPTRRPAPPSPVADAAKPRMQRGQFQLTGTAVVDAKAIAFLRETNGGKPRSVRVGDSINGVTVAEVKPDRVKLVQGDESEELLLKVAAGPKATAQPTPPPAAGAPGAPGAQPNAQAAGANVPNAAAAHATPGTPDVVDVGSTATLLERRRAARAAAAAAAAQQQAQGGAAPAQAPTPQQPASDWASVYQQMQLQQQQQQQRQRSTKP